MLHIQHADPGSQARTGVLSLRTGTVRTPAFVPLATKATVKGLLPHEVRELGYDMVLGNTFHLFLDPGHERIDRFGGLHRFMAWDGPIITDSGGFQVFSMGHGTVAEEIKGKASHGADRAGRVLDIGEEGVAFRSYLDGASTFMGPETSMEIQAALNSDIALVFDECTPFNVEREYTARSTERTHRWLDRCLDWHDANGPDGQVVYGIVQGGVFEDLRIESTQEVMARDRLGGIAIGGSLGADKDQMREVVGWATRTLGDDPRPRHLLGIGEVDDLLTFVALGIDTFDCAMPTRLGRHGMAVVPQPDTRWRIDLTKARYKDADEPVLDGCPCPCCSQGFTRGYLRYLVHAHEQTGQRLLTAHNLSYLARLMEDLRHAIASGTLTEVTKAFRDGAAPQGDALRG